MMSYLYKNSHYDDEAKDSIEQGHDFPLNQNGSDSVEELFNSNLVMICIDLVILEYSSFNTSSPFY